jgi:hypothetical protein
MLHDESAVTNEQFTLSEIQGEDLLRFPLHGTLMDYNKYVIK